MIAASKRTALSGVGHLAGTDRCVRVSVSNTLALPQARSDWAANCIHHGVMKTGINDLDRYSTSLAIPATDLVRLAECGPVERKPARSQARSALKILPPVDLSADPKPPVEQAIGIARAIGAELMLLNVADPRSDRFEWHQHAFDKALHGRLERFVVPGNDVPETRAVCRHLTCPLLSVPRKSHAARDSLSIQAKTQAFEQRQTQIFRGI